MSVTDSSAHARVHRFFERMFARDPSGATWLSQLLGAAPGAAERLGELLQAPGWLLPSLALRTVSGNLGCFEYPVDAPRELLAWYIDHPDRLLWAPDDDLTAESARLRRALVCDEPPGARLRAQQRARELMPVRSFASREWWRFEGVSKPDCVLITHGLVVTVTGRADEPLAPVTPWYPPRSELVRSVEAARALAEPEGKQWAALLLTDSPRPEAERAQVADRLTESAPHLDTAGRAQVAGAYLGNVTWRDACSAVGLSLDAVAPAASGGAA